MGQTSPKVKSKSLRAPPYRKVGHFHCPHTLPKGVTHVPITTTTYSHTLEKTAAPKAGTCAPNCTLKIRQKLLRFRESLSQAPPHTLPGPGWAGVPTRHPPTLSRSTRSFSSSSSPRAARISSCSRRFSCAQRMELPAAGWDHLLPFGPPSSAGLSGGSRARGAGRAGRGLRRR